MEVNNFASTLQPGQKQTQWQIINLKEILRVPKELLSGTYFLLPDATWIKILSMHVFQSLVLLKKVRCVSFVQSLPACKNYRRERVRNHVNNITSYLVALSSMVAMSSKQDESKEEKVDGFWWIYQLLFPLKSSENQFFLWFQGE